VWNGWLILATLSIAPFRLCERYHATRVNRVAFTAPWHASQTLIGPSAIGSNPESGMDRPHPSHSPCSSLSGPVRSVHIYASTNYWRNRSSDPNVTLALCAVSRILPIPQNRTGYSRKVVTLEGLQLIFDQRRQRRRAAARGGAHRPPLSLYFVIRVFRL